MLPPNSPPFGVRRQVISDGVHVHLEPLRVEACYEVAKLVGLERRLAKVAGPAYIRLEKRGRLSLQDTVCE